MTMSDTKRGRPPKVISPIPDTFENVIKALVTPIRRPSPEDGKMVAASEGSGIEPQR